MRIMVKFWFPVESGNAAVRSGKVGKVMQQIHEELEPEAAYFYIENGERGGHIVLNMDDSWQLADTVERYFFGLNAKVELRPVMNAEDLQKALSGVPDIIDRYG